MATKSSDSTKRSASAGEKVLGRSALTGRYVLKPASDPSPASIQKTKMAVQAASSAKKR